MTKKSGLADSPFFAKAPHANEEQPAVVHSHIETERISERNSERTENRTVALPVKRRTKRYSFEFYEDQITHIKRLKYEAEMTGKRVTLSDFARVAFDRYLDTFEEK